MVRKFFDPGATTENGGTATTPPSVASLMAQHGVVNNGASPVAQPVDILAEKKEETTPVTETAPVATTTQPQSTETAKPETPSQQTEAPAATTPQTEAAPPKPPTLQEVLRQHQPEAILKELGYDAKVVSELKELDPKMIAFLNHWKSKGDITEYVKELSTDYSKLSAEEVMRHQLRRDYPKASEQQLNILFKNEVVKRFNLDSDDEDEKQEGVLLLEAKAEKFRDELVSNQQNFLLPKPPEPNTTDTDNREQEVQQAIEAYKSKVTDNPFVKNIFATKQFSIGDGDDKFNYPVDPEALTELLFDSSKWVQAISNEDGTPKVEHSTLVAMVAKYGQSFLDEYAKHFKSLGGKAAIIPIENASPPGGPQAAPTESRPQSPAEAMARHGRVV